MKNLDTLFSRLAQSKYRRSFGLKKTEVMYLRRRGLFNVMKEGREFIEARLKPAIVYGEASKTPTKGHPVFVAQHATATNDRESLSKWHGIPEGRDLSNLEVDYILSLIEYWIESEEALEPQRVDPSQPSLF